MGNELLWFLRVALPLICGVLGFFFQRYVSGMDEEVEDLRKEIENVRKDSKWRDQNIQDRLDGHISTADNLFARKPRIDRLEERVEKQLDGLRRDFGDAAERFDVKMDRILSMIVDQKR